MPFRLIHMLLLVFLFEGVGKVYGQEEGLASFYHHRFHGKKSASGRSHDIDELVAAHRTHPFGTFLRVTNLENMKAAIVCVTDRGPYRKKRILDVSHSVAKLLDFKEQGVARVRVEVVPGKTDLRWLDLLYPHIPYLETKQLLPTPPYQVFINK